ncbi:MAG: hypothetical protein ACP5U2_16785 [Bryobacteraceae bacterium]
MDFLRRCALAVAAAKLRSSDLAPLPRGLAGQFVGVHGDRLIVVGGTYWDRPRWEGGRKQWSAGIFTLGAGEAAWRLSGEQPEPLAYGGSVSTQRGLICAGGQGLAAASATVSLLAWDGVRVRVQRLPELPEPRMMLGAALADRAIVVVGGQPAPDRTASADAWMLDLSGECWRGARWRRIESLPSVGRIPPAVAASARRLFVASGAEFLAAAEGQYRRRYLRDVFGWTPRGGWCELPGSRGQRWALPP